VVRVELPGDPTPPDIVRANALAHLPEGGVVIARPGPDNVPRQMVMRDTDGGLKTFTAAGLREMTLITPANADQVEYMWEWAQRRGAGRCGWTRRTSHNGRVSAVAVINNPRPGLRGGPGRGPLHWRADGYPPRRGLTAGLRRDLVGAEFAKDRRLQFT
jgi:hypothetical protein